METSKKIEGPTPNGGDHAIVYFFDVDGNRTSEEESVGAEFVEIKDGAEIFRTHTNAPPTPSFTPLLNR